MQCLRRGLQLLLCCTVALFFVYLSAISLSAWWLSSAQGALGGHLNFPYLSAYVAKRFDKADKFFAFPLPQDLAVAVRAGLLVLEASPITQQCAPQVLYPMADG